MNSKGINKWTVIALLLAVTQGVKVESTHQLHTESQGIFGRMIE
jgi:hypothetical protein